MVPAASGAGAGDNQVLRVFNNVNDVVTGDGINASGQLGVNGDIQVRYCRARSSPIGSPLPSAVN